ncbi:MAG: alpha/beta hydrolase [Actinomycetota bacterium]|nr:alpha/beta hydrolase [Actinomycetota bacterium]
MPPSLVASTDGVQVAVHDLGGPDAATAPTLLLCHANGFNARAWTPLVTHLVDRFRCFAVDLRGHGEAVTPPDLSFEWAGFGDDVQAVLASSALPAGAVVHGVGHSLGGAALVMAAAAAPSQFRSLWLYEPIVHPPGALEVPDGLTENPMAAAASRRRPDFDSVDAAVANYAAKPPLSTLDPAALRAYVEGGFAPRPDGSITLRCRPEWEAAIFRMGVQHRAWDDVPQVTVPTAVVVGAEQQFGPSAFAPGVADRLPLGYLLRHPELGHFGPLEDPAGMAAEIVRWVE